jgi:hypothetical protein
MLFLTAALTALITFAGPAAAWPGVPAPANAGAATDPFPTTDATAVIVARTGMVDRAGRAVVDLAVVCPVQGTIDGLELTFEQHRRGQVTQGFTDLDSFGIPCSPEGVHMQLALEVFTDIYFGPGRIVVTESIACGISGCTALDSGASTILHLTRN